MVVQYTQTGVKAAAKLEHNLDTNSKGFLFLNTVQSMCIVKFGVFLSRIYAMQFTFSWFLEMYKKFNGENLYLATLVSCTLYAHLKPDSQRGLSCVVKTAFQCHTATCPTNCWITASRDSNAHVPLYQQNKQCLSLSLPSSLSVIAERCHPHKVLPVSICLQRLSLSRRPTAPSVCIHLKTLHKISAHPCCLWLIIRWCCFSSLCIVFITPSYSISPFQTTRQTCFESQIKSKLKCLTKSQQKWKIWFKL